MRAERRQQQSFAQCSPKGSLKRGRSQCQAQFDHRRPLTASNAAAPLQACSASVGTIMPTGPGLGIYRALVYPVPYYAAM